MRRTALTFTFLACAAIIPAQAQAPMFGGKLAYAAPIGNTELQRALKADKDFDETSSLGYGLSLFLEQGFQRYHAARYSLDYTIMGGVEDKWGYKLDASSIGLKAEYLYRVRSHDYGLYSILGFGLSRATWKQSSNLRSDSVSATGADVSVGLGFNFNRNVGMEFKLVQSAWYKFEDEDLGYKSKWVQDWAHCTIGLFGRF